MSRKLTIISLSLILLLIGAVAFGVWKTGTKNQSAEAAATKTGLVGYWTMDSNDTNGIKVYDKSGSNKTMTATYGLSPTSTIGKIKQAVNFNTVALTSPFYLSGGNILNVDETDEVTLSAWIKTTDLTTHKGVIFKWDAAGCVTPNQSYHLIVLSDGRVQAGANSDNETDNTNATTKTVNDGQWHLLTFSAKDGTNNYNIYIDGVNYLQTTKSGTGIKNSTIDFYIGQGDIICSGEENRKFIGQIDDVRIYNRALSAQEVSDLYNSAKTTYITSAPKTASSTNSGQLVGHWTMDVNDMSPTGATLYDRSGQNNHGTITGTTTSTGKIGQARSFIAASDEIIATDSNSLRLGVGNFTLATWFKTTDTSAAMIDKWAATGGNGQYQLAIVTSKLNGKVWNGGYGINLTANTVITDNKWHHGVFVVDADGTSARIYLDGVQDGSVTGATAKNSDSDGTLRIGDNSAGSDQFDGLIDDVRIYNYAMSAQEVSNLYNSAKTNYVASATKTGLVGHWTMDNTDRSRNLIYDKSGFNNTGTLTGTTTSTGRIKEARSFNGTTDWINVGDVLDMDASNAITLSAWVKVGTLAHNGIVIAKWDADASCTNNAMQSYLLGIVSNGKIQFSINSSSNGADNTITGNRAINDNKWHYIVFTGTDGTNNLNIYIDGVVDYTGTKNGTGILNSSTSLEIGSGIPNCDGRATYIFSGAMDDVRIYNRALSAQEVSDLYNSAKTNYQ